MNFIMCSFNFRQKKIQFLGGFFHKCQFFIITLILFQSWYSKIGDLLIQYTSYSTPNVVYSKLLFPLSKLSNL